MSLRNNPLSDFTEEVKPERDKRDKNEVTICKTAYGEVTQLVHEDKKYSIHNMAKQAVMFLAESLWFSVRKIGEVVLAIGVLALLIALFVIVPMVGVFALLEGHWAIGGICSLVGLTAWGAVLNEDSKNR